MALLPTPPYTDGQAHTTDAGVQVRYTAATKKWVIIAAPSQAGGGSGDMAAAIYDPQTVENDAFARANHTGEQAVGTVTGLQGALDGKAPTSHGHTSSEISDSTVAGRAVLTAADAAAQRSALGVDAAGTDNSVPVTLAGTPDYLTLAGQQITRGPVDLAAHVFGDLPLANLAPAGAASRLLGRGSETGAGDFEEITVGAGLLLIGTTLSAPFDTYGLAPAPANYLAGGAVAWVSATAVDVEPGEAKTESGDLLTWTSAISLTGISLGASVWGYVYVYDAGGGTVAAECVTTAPVRYFGGAYSKTGAATHRLVGVVRTDGSGNILTFYATHGAWMLRTSTDWVFATALDVVTETEIVGVTPLPTLRPRVYGKITGTGTSFNLRGVSLGDIPGGTAITNLAPNEVVIAGDSTSAWAYRAAGTGTIDYSLVGLLGGFA